MQYKIHPEARAEYPDAIAYYDKRQPGLDARFAAEIEATIQRILEWPMASPILENDMRGHLTKKFPYGILYEDEDDAVHIYMPSCTPAADPDTGNLDWRRTTPSSLRHSTLNSPCTLGRRAGNVLHFASSIDKYPKQ